MEKEQAKVQKLRDEGADPHDIKYAVSERWAVADQRTSLASACQLSCRRPVPSALHTQVRSRTLPLAARRSKNRSGLSAHCNI